MRRGPAPQREPISWLVFVLRVRHRARVTSTITIRRLPIFGADPLRSATIHPVPRDSGHRGSNLLTQTGRISLEEPQLTESLVDLDK